MIKVQQMLRSGLAALLAVGIGAGAAHAATIVPGVTFTSATVDWDVTGNVVALRGTHDRGANSDRISWGLGHRDGGFRQSAYTFDAIDPSSQTAMGVLVNLGTFTHSNFAIETGRNLRRATLNFDLGLSFNLGGAPHQRALQFDWDFSHWETLNSARPCANGGRNGRGVNRRGCADRVIFSDAGNGFREFIFEEGVVTLELLGFTPRSPFWTVENRRNTSDVFARFSFAPTPVPLPAAGWLLLGSLGGLAALRRRGRQAGAQV